MIKLNLLKDLKVWLNNLSKHLGTAKYRTGFHTGLRNQITTAKVIAVQEQSWMLEVSLHNQFQLVPA